MQRVIINRLGRVMNSTTFHAENTDFVRTATGAAALSNPAIKLNIKQRQFLLLVGKPDELSQRVCSNIAEQLDIQKLVDNGWIAPSASLSKSIESKNTEPKNIKPVISSDPFLDQIDNLPQSADFSLPSLDTIIPIRKTPLETSQTLNTKIKPNTTSPVICLSSLAQKSDLEWAKNLMISSLKKAGDSNRLIQRIENAGSLPVLCEVGILWRDTLLQSPYCNTPTNKQQVSSWIEQLKYILSL